MSQTTNFVLEGFITAEQPLATCSKDLLDREGEKHKPVPVPSTQTAAGKRLMFPSTGIRGTLRRRVRDVVRDGVIEVTGDPKPFNLDTHYMLTLGGVKGTGEEDKTSISRIHDVRQRNPLLNLFGAGDAGTVGFMGGRLSVGNAICVDVSEPVVFSGARADDLYRDKDQSAFLSDADLLQLVGRAEGNRERAKLKAELAKKDREFYVAKSNEADEATLEGLRAEAKQIEARMNSVKEESGSDNSVGMPLAGWQAIPEGAVMKHRMILTHANQVDMGLLLAGLDYFSLFPIIGAHYANGNGLVSASWDVFEVTRRGKVPLGTITCEPFSNLSVPANSYLSECQEAFASFMQSQEWDFSVPERV